MDFDWQSLMATLLPYLPDEMAGNLAAIGSFAVALCAIIARFWARPADGSKWLPVYNLINQIGMNSKHAANAADQKK